MLGTRLRLRTAVAVQTLTASEVQGYLERIGEPAYRVQAALKEDPQFWELMDTPLMLWVALLAYRDAPVELSREDTFEQRRRRLFANFVDAMFKRRSAESHYTQQQTLSWLGSLARALTRTKQTVFYLESLGVDTLPTLPERWLSRTGIVLACIVVGALIGGLIFGLIELIAPGDLLPIRLIAEMGLTFALISGLFVGLIATFTKLQPVQVLRFSFTVAKPRMAKALRGGLIVGVICGLCGLIAGLSYGLIAGLTLWLTLGLTLGLTFGLSAGLSAGLLRLITTEVVESSRTPNQGTHASIKNAVLGLMIVGSSVGAIAGFSVRIILGPSVFPVLGPSVQAILGSADPVSAGSSVGIIAGIVAGQMVGGLFAIRHLVLRLALWMKGAAPLNYVPFLEYATERLFLRKVGGGYIFLHRMLLEYFATLEEPSGHPDRDLRASAR